MLPLTIIFVVLAVMYYRTPVDIPLLEGSHTLHFPRGIVVDAKDIVELPIIPHTEGEGFYRAG